MDGAFEEAAARLFFLRAERSSSVRRCEACFEADMEAMDLLFLEPFDLPDAMAFEPLETAEPFDLADS